MYYIFNFLLIAGMCILYIYCPTGKLRNFKKFSLQFSHGKIILGGGIDIAGFLFFGQIIVPVIDHSGNWYARQEMTWMETSVKLSAQVSNHSDSEWLKKSRRSIDFFLSQLERQVLSSTWRCCKSRTYDFHVHSFVHVKIVEIARNVEKWGCWQHGQSLVTIRSS